MAATVADLEEKLAIARIGLRELEDLGSARDQYIGSIKLAEQTVFVLGTGTYNRLLDDVATEKHEVEYRELPPTLKESVRFAVDRKGVRGFTNSSFVRLGRLPEDQITNSAVEATVHRLVEAVGKLEQVLK